MKFLHTADLHLDSAFCASSASEGAARRERQRTVLKKIFLLASQESCDMILIAGDLFDGTFVAPETRQLCIRLFAEFGGPVVIAPGNHDSYTDGSFYKDGGLPENVHVFSSPEIQFFDFPELDTTVAGYAFVSSSLPKNPLSDELPTRHNGRILLLCAHADADNSLSPYAPIPTSSIVRHGFDYAALGHIHKYTPLTENIRYCGFAEGRSFDEIGDGGVLIVSTDGFSHCKVERRTVSDVKYVIEKLYFDESTDESGSFESISQKIKDYTEHGRCMLRLELEGTIRFDMKNVCERVNSQTSDAPSHIELIDRTLTLPDKEQLEKDTTLRGEFYRSLLPKLEDADATVRGRALKALYIGLAAIDGRDFSGVRGK